MKIEDRELIFSYINRLTDVLKTECDVLCETIDNIGDSEDICRKVMSLESDGDEITHELYRVYKEKLLSADNEARSLYTIFQAIEECVDQVEEVSKCIVRYNITSLRDDSVAGFDSAKGAAHQTEKLMFSLKNMDKNNTPFRDIIELDHYKIDNRKIYDESMYRLFTEEKDAIEIIKWKEIYNAFRDLFTAFEEVSEASAKYVSSIY